MSAPSSLEGVQVVYVEDLLQTESCFEKRKKNALDDPLYLVYTGGTTAASKCVVQTHRDLEGKDIQRSKCLTKGMALHELGAYPDFGVMNCEDRILHHTSAYWGATCTLALPMRREIEFSVFGIQLKCFFYFFRYEKGSEMLLHVLSKVLAFWICLGPVVLAWCWLLSTALTRRTGPAFARNALNELEDA